MRSHNIALDIRIKTINAMAHCKGITYRTFCLLTNASLHGKVANHASIFFMAYRNFPRIIRNFFFRNQT